MRYAEVAVNAPTAWPRTFTYGIPAEITVRPGSAVWVPFGSRLLQGIVFGLTDTSPVEETRDIVDTIGRDPLLTPGQLQLAKWVAEHYFAPYFEAAALMLPPAFERKTITILEPLSDPPADLLAKLDPMPRKALSHVQKHGPIDARRLEKVIAKKHVKPAVDRLVRLGLIARSTDLQRPRIGPKTAHQIRLVAALDRAQDELTALSKRRATNQAGLLDLLIRKNEPMMLTEAGRQSGASSAVARALERKGLVAIEEVRVQRDPLAHRTFGQAIPPELTPLQTAAWEPIRQRIRDSGSKQSPRVFLLHGITGSGKTEVYLRALSETIAAGKRGIILVPEIALTPQTIQRFASRFPDRVAVLHSRLSPGEQFDEWHRIREGEFDVVVGSRSAAFAPQPNLGLIVIDEEHEWTYKQHEKTPLYHARDVALKLAELTGAIVILGSATPDTESYYRAQTGEYQLLELPERVGECLDGASPVLPTAEVVDLRQELRQGNRSIFSRKLAKAMDRVLSAQEQVILFLNRRGAASIVQCRDCGHVMRCRRCEATLTHHSLENQLICHLCNYRTSPPESCPECGKRRIKFLGIGTQKLAEETAKSFPRARILRWDRDATRGKHSHEEILDRFQSHQADVLIGTQMIAKGLDIPLVTLVGVINADIGLYLPDFRAGERTFQILCQVTGRAGRGPRGGIAIIQTYTPEHYAIQAAAKHDFRSFYEQEITYRRQYGYPPFNRLVRMVYAHTNSRRCEEEAHRMAAAIKRERDAQGLGSLSLIGPSPAYAARVRGRYRWQLVIRGTDPMAVVSRTPIPQSWTVDVDPVGL